MMIAELETDRLLLRQWVEQDSPIFAVLNSDPEVMEYFPALLSREESNAMAEKCKSLMWCEIYKSGFKWCANIFIGIGAN